MTGKLDTPPATEQRQKNQKLMDLLESWLNETPTPAEIEAERKSLAELMIYLGSREGAYPAEASAPSEIVPLEQILHCLYKLPHDPRLSLPPTDEAWNNALVAVSKQATGKDVAYPVSARAALHPHVDGQNFYELCQEYRHSKEIPSHPGLPNTVQAFNNLREYIKTGALPWPSYEDWK